MSYENAVCDCYGQLQTVLPIYALTKNSHLSSKIPRGLQIIVHIPKYFFAKAEG